MHNGFYFEGKNFKGKKKTENEAIVFWETLLFFSNLFVQHDILLHTQIPDFFVEHFKIKV